MYTTQTYHSPLSLSLSYARTHLMKVHFLFYLFITSFFFLRPPPVGGGAGVGYTQAFSSVTLVGEEIC